MDVSKNTIALFTSQDVCNASGLTKYQVAQLRKKGLINPHKQADAKLLYKFSDLTVARDIARLLTERTSFAKVVSTYVKLMGEQGNRYQHASAIKLFHTFGSTGNEVLMISGEKLVSADSGHAVFDFHDIAKPKRSRRVQTLESLRRDIRVAAESEVADDWYEYALDCEDDENLSEAKRAYEVCVSHDENFADAWVNLGRLHFLKGLQMDSRYCYERALSIDKNHQIGNYNLGILFEMFDAHEYAIKHLEKAESIPESFRCLARIHLKLGNTKRAERYENLFKEKNSDDSI